MFERFGFSKHVLQAREVEGQYLQTCRFPLHTPRQVKFPEQSVVQKEKFNHGPPMLEWKLNMKLLFFYPAWRPFFGGSQKP